MAKSGSKALLSCFSCKPAAACEPPVATDDCSGGGPGDEMEVLSRGGGGSVESDGGEGACDNVEMVEAEGAGGPQDCVSGTACPSTACVVSVRVGCGSSACLAT